MEDRFGESPNGDEASLRHFYTCILPRACCSRKSVRVSLGASLCSNSPAAPVRRTPTSRLLRCHYELPRGGLGHIDCSKRDRIVLSCFSAAIAPHLPLALSIKSSLSIS